MTKQIVLKAPKVKEQKSEMDLMTLFEKFGNDEKCRMYLEQLRWPYGIQCTRCGSEKISRIYKRNQFACDSCKLHFSVTSGTIFHDSHLPLMKWFAAVYLLSESKKGMSALQLKRTLKVAYKTAWYLCHRIREAVKDADTSLLNGVCEADETWIGGKAKNMHKKDWQNKKGIGGPGGSNKIIVAGAIQRGGKVRMQVVPTVDADVLRAFLKAKIADEARAVCTDEHYAYRNIIEDANTQHGVVKHSAGQYVFGDVHTNTMENVWSLFKRSIIGSYHKLSVKHMERYLDEFEFRFNNRHNPFLFRDTLLRLLQSANLEYKELTKEKAA
jgi:transposase-like protein